MKATIFDKTGKEKGTVSLPENFSVKIRKDILAKVFEAQKRFQPYGAMDFAGRNYSASGISRKKRHAWKVTYGKGISRAPRKIMSRHGSSFNWVGASAPYARGGGRAHAHRAEENQFRKINKKELELAMNSAFAGTVDVVSLEKKYLVKLKGAAFVADKTVLSLKTKEFLTFLENLFGAEILNKILIKKAVRAGKGKSRGRKYKSNRGLLFVLGKDEKMNRKGIEVAQALDLKIEDLAPNGQPGRLTIYTENALNEIKERFK